MEMVERRGLGLGFLRTPLFVAREIVNGFDAREKEGEEELGEEEKDVTPKK